jgi:hypothetical protein
MAKIIDLIELDPGTISYRIEFDPNELTSKRKQSQDESISKSSDTDFFKV